MIYLFVDGGHLREYYGECARRWTGSDGEIDFKLLKESFQAFKMFYYDCLDDTRHASETKADFDERLKAQEAFFNKINGISGSHVRYGSLTGAGKKKRQKEVDILLAVDMMNHAARKNMERAILLSGDRDFKPVVKSLVDMGLFVDVCGDKYHTSEELAMAADSYTAITLSYYHKWSTRAFQDKYPPNILQISNMPHDVSKLEEGLLDGEPVGIYKWRGDNNYYIHAPRFKIHSSLTLQFHELERLKLYFELQYGRVQWSPVIT